MFNISKPGETTKRYWVVIESVRSLYLVYKVITTTNGCFTPNNTTFKFPNGSKIVIVEIYLKYFQSVTKNNVKFVNM